MINSSWKSLQDIFNQFTRAAGAAQRVIRTHLWIQPCGYSWCHVRIQLLDSLPDIGLNVRT